MTPVDFIRDVEHLLHAACERYMPSVDAWAIRATTTQEEILPADALDALLKLVAAAPLTAIVGNGGSQAIAAHMAADFWTQARRPCVAPTDPVLLTALANDHGYDAVFSEWMNVACAPPMAQLDLLIAMSCSGGSENVIRAVHAARSRGVEIVTLTGFSPDNSLRRIGDLNFYVPSESYGVVQVAHLAILHAVCDALAAGLKA